jgi:arylsulfatase
MDQGFALYSDLWVGHKRPAEDTNEVALGWVRLAGKRPFFLFLNYVDAHAPFAPPGYDVDDSHLFEPLGIDIETFQWAAMRKLKLTDLPDETAAALVERYDAGILAQDSALRTLFEELDRLGVLERSVVVVVADHGESFGEGQMWGHGGLSIDPQSRVPLLYRSPARPELAGTRDAEPISIVEIPSMILRDLAAPDPDRLSGGRSARAPVYGERFSEHGSMRMLMEGSHKYLLRIRVGEDATRIERVYDVASDPEEKVNLAQTDPQKLGELRSHYREILESLGLADEGTSVEAVPPAHERTPEDVALREQLRALGYLD